MNNSRKFDLRSPMFEKMLGDLSKQIEKIFGDMEDRKSENATITLKIALGTPSVTLADNRMPQGYREATFPKVIYKITRKLDIKDELEGTISNGIDDELLKDGHGNYYIVPQNEVAGQISMFGEEEES